MKTQYFIFFLLGVILICKNFLLFGYGEQDLGSALDKKGGPELTIINNSGLTLLLDGIVFLNGSKVGGRDDFSQIVIPSSKTPKIIRSSKGTDYFWGEAHQVSGGFDVTRDKLGTKDFQITLPTKQGEFDLDPSCTASKGIGNCPKLQWFVEWNGNGWQVRFEHDDQGTGWVPADEADNGGMW